MSLQATATFTFPDPESVVRSYIVPRIMAAVDRAEDVVVQEAQSIVPVDTGELGASISKDPVIDTGSQVIGIVAARAHHAQFVEFGTGLRGMGTYPWDLPTSGVPITSSWQYDYRRQGWVGMPASPYMRPAIDSGRDRILACFKDMAL